MDAGKLRISETEWIEKMNAWIAARSPKTVGQVVATAKDSVHPMGYGWSGAEDGRAVMADAHAAVSGEFDLIASRSA